jgi:hypothetical protein
MRSTYHLCHRQSRRFLQNASIGRLFGWLAEAPIGQDMWPIRGGLAEPGLWRMPLPRLPDLTSADS